LTEGLVDQLLLRYQEIKSLLFVAVETNQSETLKIALTNKLSGKSHVGELIFFVLVTAGEM